MQQILVEKSKENRLGRHRHKWEDIVMNLK
jgi:hypothetical protein